MTSFSPLAAGAVLRERYKIYDLLGKGGMGAVYLVEDLLSGEEVALKQTFYGDNEELSQAFYREAKLLARLKHLALPKVTDYFAENNSQLLVMELIHGEDLSSGFDQKGNCEPMPLENVLKLYEQLFEVLVYLHAQNILHRDLKPANLKVTSNGQLKVLDFGAAKGSLTETTHYSVRVATPGYAPPEQIYGLGTNERSDVFSAAATIYHLLAGEPPPSASKRENIIRTTGIDLLQPLHELNTKVPLSISETLQKAMSLPAENRFTAVEMLQKLRISPSKPESVVAQANQIEKQENEAKKTVLQYVQELERKEAEARQWREKEEEQRKREARLKRQQEEQRIEREIIKNRSSANQNKPQQTPKSGRIQVKAVPDKSTSTPTSPKETSVFRNTFEDVFGKTTSLFPYRKGNKWGFCNDRKQIVIEPKYDEVSPFSESLARVQVTTSNYSEKYGFINSKGEEVIPLQHKYLNVFSFQEGLARVRGAKDGFIDKTGKEVIPPKWDEVNDFHDGLARVYVNQNYKAGFIDKTGKEVIPLKYDNVSDFNDGLALVLGGKGFIDKSGKVIIPTDKYSKVRDFSEGLAAIKRDEKWGFIDKTGKEIIQPKYEIASSFGKELAIVKTKNTWLSNSKWHFIDQTGNVVFSPNYEKNYQILEASFHKFSCGLIMATLNGKYGFIDKSGNEVIPCKYDNALYYGFNKGLACVQLNNKWGYVGCDGTEYFED